MDKKMMICKKGHTLKLGQVRCINTECFHYKPTKEPQGCQHLILYVEPSSPKDKVCTRIGGCYCSPKSDCELCKDYKHKPQPEPSMPLIELPSSARAIIDAYYMDGAKDQRAADMTWLPAHDQRS